MLQKNVHGVSSDWQWYTHFGVLQRRAMAPADFGRLLRERVVRVAGNPADFGAPRPDDDILVAGHSLSQDYLPLVRDGRIVCRPAIADVDGRTVTFTDGRTEIVDTIICATGYELHVPYLPDEVWRTTGPQLALHHRTIHPDLPAFGVIGQYALQGPYFPLLELQARWIAQQDLAARERAVVDLDLVEHAGEARGTVRTGARAEAGDEVRRVRDVGGSRRGAAGREHAIDVDAQIGCLGARS